MKKLPFFLVLLAFPISEAFSQKKKKMPPVRFPVDLPDSLHPFFLKQYEQGFALYNLSCSRCHSPGNKPIPIFTDSQLMNYQMRISAGHKGELTERKVSETELGLIITFLNSMKKN